MITRPSTYLSFRTDAADNGRAPWPERRTPAATIQYRYLVRGWGRGLSVAHLANERGESLCGLALGDNWTLVAHTSRRVCSRCTKETP